MRFWLHMARLGMISHETFRREADRWIEALEQPPIGLIELSVAGPSERIQLPDALNVPLVPADGLAQHNAFWDFGTLVSCLADGTTTEEEMPLAEIFHRLIAAVQGEKPMLPWE